MEGPSAIGTVSVTVGGASVGTSIGTGSAVGTSSGAAIGTASAVATSTVSMEVGTVSIASLDGIDFAFALAARSGRRISAVAASSGSGSSTTIGSTPGSISVSRFLMRSSTAINVCAVACEEST